MRKLETESYEDWLERIDLFERGVALQRLAKGEDADFVLEEFSKRITNKMKHALFDVIKHSITTDFDIEKSRKDYENNFLNKRGLVADHILDD
jgi:glutamyl-tRNA reductase